MATELQKKNSAAAPDGVHHATNKYVFSRRLNVNSDTLLSGSVAGIVFHTARQ